MNNPIASYALRTFILLFVSMPPPTDLVIRMSFVFKSMLMKRAKSKKQIGQLGRNKSSLGGMVIF
jgi:hypothetical protein